MNSQFQDPNRPDSASKKWFVYIGDDQKGPFSSEDLQEQLDDGLLKMDDYIWSEEIKKWKPINEVFTDGSPISSIYVPQQHPLVTHQLKEIAERYKNLRLRKRKKWNFIIYGFTATLVFLALGTGIYSIHRSHYFHLVETVESIVELHKISTAESRELREAITKDLDELGPSLALAHSTTSTEDTVFLITTNLPNGAQFEIEFEGIPETLLSHSNAKGHARVMISNGIAQTPPLHLASGHPLPQGEYRVIARLIDPQPSLPQKHSSTLQTKTQAQTKVVKNYFLGGAKNSAYQQKLTEYHRSLQEKSKAELLEINQFVDLLEDQLKQTQVEFQNARQKFDSHPGRGLKKWTEFHTEWESLNTKINTAFDRWTPDWLENQAYHGKLYSLVLQSGKVTYQTHDLQNQYFDTHTHNRPSEVEIAKSASLAQSLILSLRAKLQITENLPQNPNGLPPREK